MKVSRNEIIGKLHGIRGLLPEYNDLVNKYDNKLDELVRKTNSGVWYFTLAKSVVISLIFEGFAETVVGGLFAGILSVITCIGTFILLSRIRKNKIEKLNLELDHVEDEYKEFYGSHSEFFTAIGYKYWSHDAIEYMFELMEPNRAENYRELMNLTDDYIHRSNLERQNEELNMKIDQLNRDVEAVKWNSYLNS